MNRTKVIISGGIGLLGSLLITVIAFPIRNLWLSSLPPLFWEPIIAWGIFLFCLFLALLEIPLMIYGLRKVSEGKSRQAPAISLFGNGVFVFFPVIYALPNLLITNPKLIWLGIFISASSLLRFTGSFIFLPAKTISN